MLRCFSVRRASSVFSTVHRAHASRVAGSLSCRAFTSQSSNGGRQQQQQQQQLFTLFGAATAATALALSTAALGAAGPLLDSVSGVSVDSVSYCDAQDAASADTFVQTPAPTTNAHATSPHPPHPPHLPPSPPATRSPPKKPMSRRKLARRNSMRKQKRHYQYVIVGAGTTTYAAIEAIRAVDTDADILIISDQSKLPRIDIDSSEEDQLLECDALADTYNEWRRHVNSRLENEPDAYSTSALTLLLGKSRFHIDVEDRSITMKDGTRVTYDRCLLANAGEPRDFYVLDSNKISYALRDKINTMTTLQDFMELDTVLARDVDRIAVVGGGFLGTEVACALSVAGQSRGIKVSHIFVENGVLHRHLPPYLSAYVTRKMSELGVDMCTNKLVTGLQRNGEKQDDSGRADGAGADAKVSSAQTNAKAAVEGDPDAVSVSLMGWEKEDLLCDYVVLASTHIKPKTEMVTHLSGIEVDANNGGIVVNATMEAIDGLYVAGNLASYYDSTLGRRRVDRYEHAINSGLLAGHNMASSRCGGSQKMYKHSPSLRSSIPGIGVDCRAVGEIDSSLQTVGVWIANRDATTKEVVERTPDSEFRRGVVYYLRKGKVVGIMLWNAGDQMQRAREVLAEKIVVSDPTELQDAILLGPRGWLDCIVAGERS